MFWGQSMGPVADETLKFAAEVHSEDLVVRT
jgi:polysaccharide pyruvyl transferase WcaK-like protein